MQLATISEAEPPPVMRQHEAEVQEAAHGLQRLLIVRLSSMGDVIHALPAATLLRHAFPSATLGWMIEERWAELLCAPGVPRIGPRSSGRPLVDAVHVINTAAWRSAPFPTPPGRRRWERGGNCARRITNWPWTFRARCAPR
jgi:hypothetical protein